ncbi:MAG: hypothetical protein FJ041_05245 [Candidatus Cloacimonetes bacterium]|nr:hypothetical protein [Candidatus Cloacimonadota bacterium]
MKRIGLMLLLLTAVALMFGITVHTNTGKEYNGKMVSVQDSAITLSEEGIIVRIPLEYIKAVVEEGSDVTDKYFMYLKSTVRFDAHYLMPDDYFIAEKIMEKNPMTVQKAKMVSPSSKANKNQPEFERYADGKIVLPKVWYNTKVADVSELKVGDLVIFCDMPTEDEIRQSPKSLEESDKVSWTIAKISDFSTAHKGFVVLSESYKVAPDNIRIIVK